jgi:hypothetical protein
MDKVQKRNSPECHIPSSEHFKIYWRPIPYHRLGKSCAVSWDANVYFLHRNKTVNAVHCLWMLKKLLCAFCEKLLVKRHIILQHNNASPLTAHLTLKKTETFGWKVLPHPPCSPDLVPSDYHLLTPLKYQGVTMKMMRQFTKPCIPGCQILKQIYIAAAYSSSCCAGKNASIILGISWNTDRTAWVTQNIMFLCMHFCFNIK